MFDEENEDEEELALGLEKDLELDVKEEDKELKTVISSSTFLATVCISNFASILPLRPLFPLLFPPLF